MHFKDSKKERMGAGEMDQRLRCSSRGPEFNSQQPHGGSQPSVMRSDALFCVSEDSSSALICNKYINLKRQGGRLHQWEARYRKGIYSVLM